MFVSKELSFTSKFNRYSFFNIKEELHKFVQENNLKNGFMVVQSVHTTCSVFFEEFVHDTDDMGYEYLQKDLIKGLNKVFPKQVLYDDYYAYPGPNHRKKSNEEFECFRENPAILLNADAHLKASILGSSVTIIIKEGKMQTGDFGDIYFVDWDSNRSRERKCIVAFLGE